MWERIGESSIVIIVAVVLFLLFAFVLYLIEREDYRKHKAKRTRPYLVPKQEYSQSRCGNNIRHIHSARKESSARSISVRKIS